jgi:hypothetical protein
MMIEAVKSAANIQGKVMSNDFSIGNGDIILDYLSRTIYSNPIRTVCQEYISNARDAHIEMGKGDVPVRIIFPNAFDRAIKIVDEGPGITPERMINIFTKYGNSTKRGDNNQTGGFGIGSKSCFSYTDTFTIVTVSVEDGQKIRRTYVAMKETGHAPKLMEVGETQVVDEWVKTGTTISIEVKQDSDIAEFKKNIISVTQFWETRPIIEGCNPLPEWPARDWIFKSQDWGILNERHHNSFVCIDGIPYDIDSQAFSYGTLPDYDFVLFFKVGILSVALNRESIHYDDKSKAIILQRVKEMQEGMFAVLQAQCDAKPTFMLACQFACSCNMYVKGNGSFTWNGKELETSLEADSVKRYLPPNTNHNYRSKWEIRSIHATDFSGTRDGQVVLIDDTSDTEIQVKKRLQTLVDEGMTNTKFITVRWNDMKAGMDRYEIKPGDFRLLSTVPRKKVARAPKGSGAPRSKFVKNVSKYWYNAVTNHVEVEQNCTDVILGSAQDIVYVDGKLRRGDTVCEIRFSMLDSVKQAAKLLDKPIYVIPSRYYSPNKAWITMRNAMCAYTKTLAMSNPILTNSKQITDSMVMGMDYWDTQIPAFIRTHRKEFQAQDNTLFMRWFDASEALSAVRMSLLTDPAVKEYEALSAEYGHQIVTTAVTVPEIQALETIKAERNTDAFTLMLNFLDNRIMRYGDQTEMNAFIAKVIQAVIW